MQQLLKILKTENNLTIDKIINIIKEKWNVEYTYTGLKNLLIKQLNLDIDEYLNYTPRKDNDTVPLNSENIIINNDNEDLKILIEHLHNKKKCICL